MPTQLHLRNSEMCGLEQLPLLPFVEFRRDVIGEIKDGGRLAALFGQPVPRGAAFQAEGTPNSGLEARATIRLYAIIAHAATASLSAFAADVGGEEGATFDSLTPDCAQAHWFEREIAEQWGVLPLGHPWLKPIRFHPCGTAFQAEVKQDSGLEARATHDAWKRPKDATIQPGVTDFFRVQGEEIHEVAVGPVHAGVIEPGHFRFQCHGENVLHLEVSLGYQHRGVERALIGGPNKRTIHYMETLAGDTSVGHAMAYCQAVEALAGSQIPARALALRGIALELERLANHAGDLGALAGDVGYLPTASYCGRLRGDFLNMTALLCGSRFGRGLVRPGGCRFDADPACVAELQTRLKNALHDLTGAVRLLWETPSVMARFEETGVVTRTTCEELGLVGPAARACGIERDVRFEHPFGIFQFAQIPVSVWNSGDVLARAYVRWSEAQRSCAFVQEQLHTLPSGGVCVPVEGLRPNAIAVSLVEGWRGEICHAAITNEQGRFARYKVVDPSFHNWMGVAMALRNQQVSDFPLCNKSFNLSYCGHDL